MFSTTPFILPTGETSCGKKGASGLLMIAIRVILNIISILFIVSTYVYAMVTVMAFG